FGLPERDLSRGDPRALRSSEAAARLLRHASRNDLGQSPQAGAGALGRPGDPALIRRQGDAGLAAIRRRDRMEEGAGRRAADDDLAIALQHLEEPTEVPDPLPGDLCGHVSGCDTGDPLRAAGTLAQPPLEDGSIA